MSIRGVIHIGAHIGQENALYDELHILNRIFFEPIPSNFKRLQKNIGGRYPLVNKALGNANRKMTMFVENANDGMSCSLLRPLMHLRQYPHITFNQTLEINMIRLDDSKLDLHTYNLINIDVQGYELEVFKGAIKTLNNIDYIFAEINRAEVYEKCAKIDQIINFLKPYGFKLTEHNWCGNTWGEGLFIKALPKERVRSSKIINFQPIRSDKSPLCSIVGGR